MASLSVGFLWKLGSNSLALFSEEFGDSFLFCITFNLTKMNSRKDSCIWPVYLYV